MAARRAALVLIEIEPNTGERKWRSKTNSEIEHLNIEAARCFHVARADRIVSELSNGHETPTLSEDAVTVFDEHLDHRFFEHCKSGGRIRTVEFHFRSDTIAQSIQLHVEPAHEVKQIQPIVRANDDGTIQVDLDGVRHVYAETIQPFLWREVGGKDLLQARVKDGKFASWSFDAGAYESVYEPVPGVAGTDLMLPLLFAALAVVFLTTVQWLGAAFARRYERAIGNPNQASLRGVRIASVMTLLALAGWTGVLMWLFSNFTDIPAAVFLAGAFTLVALVGRIAAALYWGFVTLRPGHGTAARFMSMLWIAAFGLLLWTAATYHWIGFNPNY